MKIFVVLLPSVFLPFNGEFYSFCAMPKDDILDYYYERNLFFLRYIPIVFIPPREFRLFYIFSSKVLMLKYTCVIMWVIKLGLKMLFSRKFYSCDTKKCFVIGSVRDSVWSLQRFVKRHMYPLPTARMEEVLKVHVPLTDQLKLLIPFSHLSRCFFPRAV